VQIVAPESLTFSAAHKGTLQLYAGNMWM
jgi:hypothetical protein